MKVLVLTHGSRGDVQPYVALGLGLQARGHDVVLATSERFQSFVEGHGLDYGYMNDDLLAILDTDQGKDLLEKGSSLFQVVKSSIQMSRQIAPIQRALMRESWDAARQSQPDVVVSGSKAGAAPHIAEKLGIRCVQATVIPMFVPTRAFRFVVFPDWKLGGWFNKASYRLIRFVTNWVLSGYARDLRRTLNLPRLKSYDMLKMADGSDIPVLHGHSEAVLPRPDDWPQTAHVTGYWFLDVDVDWTPPAELAAFLGADPPPVYVGFGSMSGRDPERLARTVVEALQIAGLRGIIATGWGGLKAATGHDFRDRRSPPCMAVPADGCGRAPWRRGHDRGRAPRRQADDRCAFFRRSAVLGQSGPWDRSRTEADSAPQTHRAIACCGDA